MAYYRRISVAPYQSVKPNSHQVPCNGSMLMAAPQPAMQLSTDIQYQLLSVRSACYCRLSRDVNCNVNCDVNRDVNTSTSWALAPHV